MIESIKEHFEKEYPREGCGVISVVKGRKQFFPCTNVASDAEDFVIDSQEYMKLHKTTDIIAIVHSHPDASNEPSSSDIANCNALGMPYYIFSYPSMELNIVQPKTIAKPLIGREYVFGSTDCFEATRDYLREYFQIEVKRREPFEDDWWEKGLDYFTEERFKDYGFESVSEPKVGDVLLFAVQSPVANHCGVYLGGQTFYHHAVHRLSCRENLSKMWVDSLVGVYRYVT